MGCRQDTHCSASSRVRSPCLEAGSQIRTSDGLGIPVTPRNQRIKESHCFATTTNSSLRAAAPPCTPSIPADHLISPPPLVLLSTGDAAGAGNASQLEPVAPSPLHPSASCLGAPAAPSPCRHSPPSDTTLLQPQPTCSPQPQPSLPHHPHAGSHRSADSSDGFRKVLLCTPVCWGCTSLCASVIGISSITCPGDRPLPPPLPCCSVLQCRTTASCRLLSVPAVLPQTCAQRCRLKQGQGLPVQTHQPAQKLALSIRWG